MSHPICIKCGSKAKVTSFHSVHQGGGVGQVGLRGSTAKVLQGDGVDRRVGWGPQFITQDPPYVGAHYCRRTRAEATSPVRPPTSKAAQSPSVKQVMDCLTSAHGINVYLQLIWSCEKTLDSSEIKDAPQQLDIHFNRVDNLN